METPCLLLDRAVLASNIARVQAIASGLGLALRPHIKTHKSLEIARLQLQAGAVGLTASKVDEALVFMEGLAGELPDITCAYPVVDTAKLRRLLAASRRTGVAVRCMVDSPQAVDALAQAVQAEGIQPSVLVKIDVGLHRCGLAPDDSALPELARRVRERGLDLAGILSHAGHAYAAKDAAGVLAVARQECALMARAKAVLQEAGLAVPVVSVGSTPTVLALGVAPDACDWASVLTEIRPGNYVFMDRAPVDLGLAKLSDVSLTVLSTVVSASALSGGGHLICDAGSKVLSSDGKPHGGAGAGFGLAWPEDCYLFPNVEPVVVDRVSEEHGWLLPSQGGSGRRPVRPAVGERVRMVPNHSCPVANLAESFIVLNDDGGTEAWPVQARAKVG